MSLPSTELNQAFFDHLEERARAALVQGQYDRHDVINPATVLLLLGELQKARSSMKVMVAHGEYPQGYRDGWIDARLTPPADCKPVAWAVVNKGEKVVKVYSEPPSELSSNAQCRPLYLRPQTSLSSSVK